MPIDTNQLIDDAKCIDQCIPKGAQLSVLIKLLADLAQVSDDPSTLINNARCIDQCIPEGMRLSVIVSLLEGQG